ncbi:hypothetical protein PT2222_490005 [Paraburkholderia tropica]
MPMRICKRTSYTARINTSAIGATLTIGAAPHLAIDPKSIRRYAPSATLRAELQEAKPVGRDYRLRTVRSSC